MKNITIILGALHFKNFFYQALALKKNIAFESEKFIKQRNNIVQQLQNQLEQPPDKIHKELYTFYKRMRRES